MSIQKKEIFIIPTIKMILPAILQGIVWFPLRIIMNFFAHLEVKGTENITAAENIARKEKTGILFAVNHTSELDFIFSAVGLPPFFHSFPMFYVARISNKYREKGYGWRKYIYSAPFFLSAWGALPYKPNTGNYAEALHTHRELLLRKKNVCIFPEGKFVHDRNTQLHNAHGGVTYLAEATNAPIVPVHVVGSLHITIKNFFLRKCHVSITYGPPTNYKSIIDASQGTPDEYKAAAEKLMTSVYELE